LRIANLTRRLILGFTLILPCAAVVLDGCAMPAATTVAGSATKIVSTVAGQAGTRGNTDGTGSGATFYFPAGLVILNGNLYICDSFNSTIRQLNLSTAAVTTIAGGAGQAGNFQSAPAYFYNPEGITTDGTNLYVADSGNNMIRMLAPPSSPGASWIVSTVAGSPNGQPGNSDGVGANASFNNPLGICYDSANNTLYVADSGNSAIRAVPTNGTSTSTLVSPATGALTWPEGMAYSGGNLYVVDSGNCTVLQVTVLGGAVTVIAGQVGVKGDVDGTGSAASFDWPEGVTVDASGNLYVADTLNSTIRQVVIGTGAVMTLAGRGGTTGSANGAGNVATFNNPMRLVFDPGSSNLYVADTYNETIRQIH